MTYSRNGKLYDIKVDVIDKKIGIRGTIENKKLNYLTQLQRIFIQSNNLFSKATLVGVYEIITGSRGTDELGGPIRIAELSGDFWSKGLA